MLTMVVCLSQHSDNLRWGDTLSYKLEVGERCSLVSHYTLTTGYHQNSNLLKKLKHVMTVGNVKCYFIK